MSGSSYSTLYNLAEDQMGYVTTAQGRGVGVSAEAMVMMERRGTLERVSRGVYRLVDFPTVAHAQYMQATLWPAGIRGVLSHETALSLHQLSDVAPAKVHIAVPIGFRVQREIPGYLVVHHEDLPSEDVSRLEGMPITTPARTIRDCNAAHLGPALIRQAIDEARRSGMLDAATVAALDAALRTGDGGVEAVALRRVPK